MNVEVYKLFVIKFHAVYAWCSAHYVVNIAH